ncbi:MAG: prolipoprotein diacylglyceryl transferase [Candidatus Pacebacteria bacterium]|nr:prolipoprotein diacylglyceryl transferase [Candidatus Paceibacterota bacterium]MBP9866526.1 prolipoprotein diacylglyceryl transferase [Candidatus Paceibacterota bacterium]
MYIHLVTDYLSIFIGMQFYFLLNKKSGINPEKKIWYIVGALLGALIGSRLLAALEDPYMFLHADTWLYYYVNKTIIGGIAGGILGIEIAKKFLGIKSNTGDQVVIPLMVAIIIGRIGCQLTGVSDGTIGVVCDYLWCFKQGDEFNRHPIPLYEIIEILILLPIFYRWIQQKKFQEGFVFRLFIIIYFGMRFLFEYIKDTNSIFVSFSAIQIVCLLFVFYYIFDSIKHGLYKTNIS